MMCLRAAYLISVLLILTILSNAQVNNSTGYNYIPFDSLARKLEEKHQIRIFYNPDWFGNKEFAENISRMPLDEALSVITQISQLSITKPRENHFVFIPLTQETSGKIDDSNTIKIGDILNYGSQTQAKVSGNIVNGSTNTPLPGARIEIAGIKKVFETSESGVFTMNIPVGDHSMKVTYPGYEEKTMNLKVYSDGKINVEMYIKTIVLDEVAVFATRIDQYFRRTKMSVASIDAKTIKELPTNMGETDVIKGVSLLPGVQTTGEFGSGFNVRGGGSDQNLVLLEEVPIFNSSHLFGLTSVINPDGISNLTLFKGGIPVTYGERASSILSIKMGTDSLKRTKIIGGIGLINSRISVMIPVKNKVQIILGGRASYSDWILKSLPDIELKNSSASFNDLNLFVKYNPSRKDEFVLFAYSSNDNFKFAGSQNFYYGNLLGSLNYSRRFNSKLFSNIVAGSSFYRANYIENDTITPLEAYKISNSVFYKSAKWNFIYKMNEKHIVTLGLNAFLYDVVPGDVTPYGEKSEVFNQSIENERGLEWAGFIGDDYEISDKVGMEVGIRFSNFYYLGAKQVYLYTPELPKTSRTIYDSVRYNNGKIIKKWNGIEPRITVRYNINSGNSIRASYNRIFQYINLISNTAVVTPTDLWKLSDMYVKPLQSDQVALGYFRNHTMYELSVEAYYKEYKNVIEYKNGARIFLNRHIETDLIEAIGQSYGVEVYAKKNAGKISGWISYTFSESLRKTTSQNPQEQLNDNTWFPDNLDRPHNLVINAGYYANKRWKFGLTFNYTTGRPVTLPELKYTIKGTQIVQYSDRNKYRMPDYHRLDLSVSHFESLKIKKKWKSYWTFSLINVYGRKNAYSIYYRRDRSPFNYEGRSSLNKLYIIGRPLPTFTYNFLF